eukprot:CAMPEP_0197527950 /NCGR_PEP_ID=MMETSP1318-20131121/23323_1 /TAXON_ID=552666 /ORGANISM="Partenskyella glossopodia, Strain RCC365" /LENGTH=76 /DNA_ID=CAMNT_0043082835 /DNA_START=179 /DNA_END=409 /DNA_ORIENTATION=-
MSGQLSRVMKKLPLIGQRLRRSSNNTSSYLNSNNTDGSLGLDTASVDAYPSIPPSIMPKSGDDLDDSDASEVTLSI